MYFWSTYGIPLRIKHRNIGAPFCVKINGRNITETPERIFHGSRKYLKDSLLILKLNFCFSRMDIDIYFSRTNVEIDEIRRLHTFWHQPFVGSYHGTMEIGMPHISAIHEEVIMPSLLTGSLGLGHKPRDTAEDCIYIYGQQFLTCFLPKDINDTLPQRASPEIQQFLLITIECEMNVWIDQDNPLKGHQDIVQFRGIGLQELPTSRNIKEKVINPEITAHRTSNRLLPYNTRSLQHQFCTYFFPLHTSDKFHL